MTDVGLFLSSEELTPRELVRSAVAAEAVGFDEVYISQIGEDQQGFLEFWQRELRPALRETTAR